MGSALLGGSPAEILAVLRSAQARSPDPRLGEILDGFRRHWLAIGRRRYPDLESDVEDAIQGALLKLVSPEKLDTLQDVGRLEAWARSLFVNTMIDVARDARRHTQGRSYPGSPDEDPERVLRDELAAQQSTPEETVAFRERLRILDEAIRGVEVARLRFVEDLSEREIAERRNLSRDGVAGQLKRFRKSLRSTFRSRS